MKIVVNTRGVQLETGITFLRKTFAWLINNFPQHQFIFIGEEHSLAWLPDTANVHKSKGGKGLISPLLNSWWLYYRLPALLQKYKADILVNANGVSCVRTTIPQILFLYEPDILKFHSHKKHAPATLVRKKRARNNLAAYIQKARAIVVTSAFAKKELTRLFSTPEEKIIVTGFPANEHYQYHSPTEKEDVKAQYSNGKEYFLYQGLISTDQNIINLLKGFSLFKKRQQTNMQLLLAGKIDWPANGFEEKLSAYKYRSDVQLISVSGVDEMAKLTGSAYALINPAAKPGFSIVQLHAICSAVPVITTSAEAEPGGDAVLVADGEDPVTIANQMMLLYKDEILRSELIRKGNDLKKKFTANNVANTIWNCIQESVKAH